MYLFRALLVSFALLALFHTPATAQPKVAVIAGHPSSGLDVQAKLRGTGVFAAVDLINANSLTPTVQQLQQYAAVLVYSQSSFASPAALGDNLATYLESGGGVVLSSWAALEQSFAGLGGRYYSTFTLMTPQGAGSVSNKLAKLGAVVEQGSSLLAAVNSFGCKASCRHLSSAVKNNGVVVARWDDGLPLVLRGNINGYNVVELNMFPVSSGTPGGDWDDATNGAILMRNALLYVAPGPLRPSKSSLSFNTTPVGQTAPLVLTFTNTGMAPVTIESLRVAGAHAGDFKPLATASLPAAIAPNATFDIVVTFTPGAAGTRTAALQTTITGALATLETGLTGAGTLAGLGVTPPAVNFGGAQPGVTLMKTFDIVNNTMAPLNITGVKMTVNPNIADAQPAFQLPLMLPAGASLGFNATCTPPRAGLHYGIATVSVANAPAADVLLYCSAGSAQAVLGNAGVIFGNVNLGAGSQAQMLTVGNNGYADLRVTGMFLAGANPGDFDLAPGKLPAVVAPGESFTYGISFKPMALGNRVANVVVLTDDPNNNTLAYLVAGTGVAFSQTVSPMVPLDFGMVKAGTTAMAQEASLTNDSRAPLTVKKVVVSGPQAAAFPLMNPPADNSVIAPNAKLPVSVSFKPTMAGVYTATLTFLLSDPNAPSATVTLKGQGTAGALVAQPLVVDFGGVAFGKSSNPKSIVLQNAGGAPLQVTAVELMGPDAATFELPMPPKLPLTIAPGASAMFDLIYTPGLRGMQTGTLVVTSDDPIAPMAAIQLKGAGTQAKLMVSPMNLDFGVVPSGASTESSEVTLTNVGDQALVIQSITVQGQNAGQFKVDATPGTLQPGASITARVRFAPTMAVAATASLVITPADGVMPGSVALKGTGVSMAIALSQMSLDFGIVPVGSMSDPQQVMMRNTTSAKITLSPITSSVPQFTVDTSATLLTLNPGEVTSFSVVFAPTMETEAMGKADISLASVPNKPVASLSFTGTGVPKPPVRDPGTGGCTLGGGGLGGAGSSGPTALLVAALLFLGARRRRSR